MEKIRAFDLIVITAAIVFLAVWTKETIDVAEFTARCERGKDFMVVRGAGSKYYCVAGDVIAEYEMKWLGNRR